MVLVLVSAGPYPTPMTEWHVRVANHASHQEEAFVQREAEAEATARKLAAMAATVAPRNVEADPKRVLQHTDCSAPISADELRVMR